METSQNNKPWSQYVDSWNEEIYTKDTDNKLHVTIATEDTPIEVEDEIKLPVKSILTNDEVEILMSNKDFNELSDLINLGNIVKCVDWCVTNSEINQTNYKLFLTCMEYVCECIMYFVNELNIDKTNIRHYDGTVRSSSYKLCQQKINCKYQYPDTGEESNGCKCQHYPYLNLYSDCHVICEHIKHKFESNSQILENTVAKTDKLIAALNVAKTDYNNDLQRCLKTISYVLGMMYTELETVDKCRKSEPNYDIRKYHCYKLYIQTHHNKSKQVFRSFR